MQTSTTSHHLVIDCLSTTACSQVHHSLFISLGKKPGSTCCRSCLFFFTFHFRSPIHCELREEGPTLLASHHVPSLPSVTTCLLGFPLASSSVHGRQVPALMAPIPPGAESFPLTLSASDITDLISTGLFPAAAGNVFTLLKQIPKLLRPHTQHKYRWR